MSAETSNTGWYFLLLVVIIYVGTLYFKPEFTVPAIQFSLSILKKILPVFVLVFLILFLTNYYVQPKTLVKYLGEKGGIRSWFIVLLGGVLSTGPIYMWYPLLSELKEKGMREGLIATFLYARAIKPALIPLMIVYFGIIFTITIIIITLCFSVVQGKMFDYVNTIRRLKT